MAAIIRAGLAALVLAIASSAAGAAERTIIVLDASGSMWGQISGVPKLQIARQTLRTVLKSVPSGMELGLMAYGHREKGSCADIELVVPPAAGTSEAIAAAAESLKFLGKTPLSAAVRQAAEALRYTEDKATVILITDGIETCAADPCAVGRELEAAGINFTAHVVGFGLTADEGRQVACLAENTGGKYLQASDAAGLEDALTETVVVQAQPVDPAPAPQPAASEFNFLPSTILAEGAPPLINARNAYVIHKANADGTPGEYVITEYSNWKGKLEPGDYIVTAKHGKASVQMPVRIEADAVARPIFVLNAGTLIVHPRRSEGGEIAPTATVVVEYPGGGNATEYGEVSMVLPAGEQKLSVTIGQGMVTQTLQLAAGETVERDVVVGVGRVVANAFYTPGLRVDDGGLSIKIFKAKTKIDGTREQVAYAFGPDSGHDLPTGDYVVVAEMDRAIGEAPFTIKVGAQVVAEVVLNAGVLSVSAPGAEKIEVFAEAKDIQGKRKEFGLAYSSAHQTTLPAGDYVVVATPAGGAVPVERAITVKAGERSELTFP